MGALGLLGILALWGVLGLLPAWIALIPTRGRALPAMPFAFISGVAAGCLVALLGDDSFVSFWISTLLAMAAGLAATVAWLAFKSSTRGERLRDA